MGDKFRDIPGDALVRWAEFVLSGPEIGPFEPFATYNRDGGQWEFYLSDEACYAKQISPSLTLYIGQESGRVVGCIVVGPPLPEDGSLVRESF